jgi:hypothetical protein
MIPRYQRENEPWNVATRVAVDRLVVNRLADRRKGVCSLVAASGSLLKNSCCTHAPENLVRKASARPFACVCEEGVAKTPIGAVAVKLRPGVHASIPNSPTSLEPA